MSVGIFVSTYTKGIGEGIKDSVIGVIIPVAVLFILFLLRFLGAGDIKLLSAVGAFTGIGILKIILYAFISGGVISIIYIIGNCILSVANRNNISDVKLKEESGACTGIFHGRKIHFSLAVFAGTTYYMLVG